MTERNLAEETALAEGTSLAEGNALAEGGALGGEAVLRPAWAEELPRLLEIEGLCFSDPWTEGAFASHFASASGETSVLTLGGRVAGYLAMTLIPPEAEVCRVAVHPSFRRQGIGKRLLSDFFCRHEEVKTVFLEVRQGNLAAQGLYASLGFDPVGRRPRYYENPTEDAVVMKWERGKDLADSCI